MDLKAAAWMVRSLGQGVSCVHLLKNGAVLAGGWDGRLTMWDNEGNTLWTAETGQRISDMAVDGSILVVTSGLDLVAFDLESGEMAWSVALEGSADEVRWWEGDILAVSSVYDIEHNDFLESAIWCFTKDGSQQWVNRMDERPWALVAHEERLYAGLGRPRCGWLLVDGEAPFDHVLPPTSFPVTCGTSGQTRALFGQTDGAVVAHTGDVISTEQGAVEFLSCLPSGYAVSTDQGALSVNEPDGTNLWSHQGNPLTAQTQGPLLEQGPTLWVSRRDGPNSNLIIYHASSGAQLAQAAFGLIHSMDSQEKRTVVGCEDGEVVVWDAELLSRRLSNAEVKTSEPLDERKAALQAKLRALRG